MQQEVFTALADPTRRRLMSWLATRPATATELAKERHGREVRYRLEARRLAAASEWIATVSARWEARIGRLRRYLEEGERHGDEARR